jgi:hypothetical protein
MVVEEIWKSQRIIKRNKLHQMKSLIRLEEALMLAMAVYLNSFLPFSPWLYWILFLTPDIGMIGYLINSRTGAFTYNLLHHKGVAILLYMAGIYFQAESLQFTGLLLFGHSAFDRMLGYGLKYNESFHNTHLGFIGKKASQAGKG